MALPIKPEQTEPPTVEIVREWSLEGFTKETIRISNMAAAREFLKQGDPMFGARGLFYTIIIGTFMMGLAFVLAGIALVYLDATGSSELNLFGATISSTNAGIVSIFIGAVVLIRVINRAMKHITHLSGIR